jgi:hypothetical protein
MHPFENTQANFIWGTDAITAPPHIHTPPSPSIIDQISTFISQISQPVYKLYPNRFAPNPFRIESSGALLLIQEGKGRIRSNFFGFNEPWWKPRSFNLRGPGVQFRTNHTKEGGTPTPRRKLVACTIIMRVSVDGSKGFLIKNGRRYFRLDWVHDIFSARDPIMERFFIRRIMI